MKNLTRRDFIRITALMGGSSLFAGCHLFGESATVPEYINGAPAADPVETLSGVTNVYTVCGLCPGKCGIRCRVAQGVLVKIGGNPYSPISTGSPLPFGTHLQEALVHGGSVCAIGGSGVQTLYDPFRIARPLKRVGPRGSGKWAALSWEDAIREIVQGGDLFGEGPVTGLKRLKEAGEGPALLAGNADWGSLTFLKRFLGSFPGSVLLRDRTSLIDETARKAGDSVFGPGTGPVAADYRNTRFVLSVGDAPLDSGVPLVSIARDIANARVGGIGFRWAVVDPRLSTSASKSDLWIPIIPGKDLHLALGIMKALADSHHDLPGVREGMPESGVPSGTVEDYARVCGVSPRTISEVARVMAQEGPRTTAIPGSGILRQSDGLETAQAILTLNWMVGSTPGSGGLVARDDTFLQRAEKKLLEPFETEFKTRPFGTEVTALILWATDPVYDDPQAGRAFLQDRKKVPLLVAIDSEITETSALADYILPDTTYLERWDICASPPSIAEPGIGVRSPVVGRFDHGSGTYYPIIPGTKPMEEIVSHLATELRLPGFQRDASGKPWNAWAYFQQTLTALIESMKDAGFPLTGSGNDRETVIERGGLFLTDASLTKARPSNQAKGSRPPISITPPSDKPRADEEGLLLITYSLPFHRSPRSSLNSWLLEVLPANRAVISNEDARKLGIKDLDRVLLESIDGKTALECTAQVAPGIRPGVVGLAGGFGYTQSGVSAQIINGVRRDADKVRGAGVNPSEFNVQTGPIRIKVKKA